VRIAVYTCATDSHLPTWVPNNRQDLAIDFLLFTTNSKTTAKGWKTRQIPSSRELDPYRITRLAKAMPHRFLDDYDLSVYVDSNVKPQSSWLSNIVNLMGPKVIGLFSRGYLLEHEFAKVAQRRYDDLVTLERQYATYKYLSGSVLTREVQWGGLIVRRHLDDDCKRFGERWWENIVRFSRRDQLSLPLALEEIAAERRVIWAEEFNGILDILPKPAKSVEYLFGEPYEKLVPRSFFSREAHLEREVTQLRRILKSKLISQIRGNH